MARSILAKVEATRLYTPLFLDKTGDIRPSTERELNSISNALFKFQTTDQYISGVKTFKDVVKGIDPVAPEDLATKAYVDANSGGGGGGNFNPAANYNITGNWTFSKVIKYTGNPAITDDAALVTKKYVDDAIAAGGGSGYVLHPATSTTLGGVKIGAGLDITADGNLSSDAVLKTGDQTVAGTKTFSGKVILNTAPSNTTDAVNKKYVDDNFIEKSAGDSLYLRRDDAAPLQVSDAQTQFNDSVDFRDDISITKNTSASVAPLVDFSKAQYVSVPTPADDTNKDRVVNIDYLEKNLDKVVTYLDVPLNQVTPIDLDTYTKNMIITGYYNPIVWQNTPTGLTTGAGMRIETTSISQVFLNTDTGETWVRGIVAHSNPVRWDLWTKQEFVTLNTNQIIDGTKTFTDAIVVGSSSGLVDTNGHGLITLQNPDTGSFKLGDFSTSQVISMGAHEIYMNSRKMTGLGDPTEDEDAANKKYVDDATRVATTSRLGVIQVGSGLSITPAGLLSATGGGGGAHTAFLGQIQWFTNKTYLAPGFVAANGQTLTDATYPEFAAALRAGTMAAVIPDADWLADASKRGNYTVGDGNTTFRLPDLNGVQTGSIAAPFLRGDSAGFTDGQVQTSAAPNIIGTLKFRSVNGISSGGSVSLGTGAFAVGYNNAPDPVLLQAPSLTSSSGKGDLATFDASDSNPIYGRTSAEIRPNSVVGCWAICLSNGSFDVGNMDVSQLTTKVGNMYDGTDTGVLLKAGDFGIGSTGADGEVPVVSVQDANTALSNGWYAASGVNAVNFYNQYAPMMTMARNSQRVQMQIDPGSGVMASRATGNGGTSWTAWIKAGASAFVLYDASTRAIEFAHNVSSVNAAPSNQQVGSSIVHFTTPMKNQHYMPTGGAAHGLSDSADVSVSTSNNIADRGVNQCLVRARVTTSGAGWVTAGGKVFVAFFGG